MRQAWERVAVAEEIRVERILVEAVVETEESVKRSSHSREISILPFLVWLASLQPLRLFHQPLRRL